jgi:hypothetical protein
MDLDLTMLSLTDLHRETLRRGAIAAAGNADRLVPRETVRDLIAQWSEANLARADRIDQLSERFDRDA